MQVNYNSLQSPFLEICCIIKSFPLEWKFLSFHSFTDLYFALNNLIYLVTFSLWLLQVFYWHSFVTTSRKTKKPQPQQNVSITQSQDGFHLENVITPGNSGKQETADFMMNQDYREFLSFTDPTAIKSYLSSCSLGSLSQLSQFGITIIVTMPITTRESHKTLMSH